MRSLRAWRRAMGGNGWPIFVMIGTTVAAVVAVTGGTIGWYIAAGWIIGIVILAVIAKYWIVPGIERLEARRERVRARTAVIRGEAAAVRSSALSSHVGDSGAVT